MITGLIPARGGSKSIPLKNITMVAGKPLLWWACKAASDSELLVNTFVATDSDEIKNTVLDWGLPGIRTCWRSPGVSGDTASTVSVMMEFRFKVNFNHLVTIQATSPLLTAHDIDEGIRKYWSKKYDSLVSVVRQHRFLWKEEDGYAYPVNHKLLERPRRQDWDGEFVENGAFVITSREALLRSESRLSGAVGLYEMHGESYIEVDEPSDLVMVEALLKEKINGNNEQSRI